MRWIGCPVLLNQARSTKLTLSYLGMIWDSYSGNLSLHFSPLVRLGIQVTGLD
jgi:hypothetical protein